MAIDLTDRENIMEYAIIPRRILPFTLRKLKGEELISKKLRDMKKMLIVMVLILPLFLFNNVQAQNGDDGFHVSGWVSAPDVCPHQGILYGYIESLGQTHFGYTLPGQYTLYWNQIFTGPEACDVWCETIAPPGGYYCHDEETIVLPYQVFYLDLIPVEVPVEVEDPDPGS